MAMWYVYFKHVVISKQCRVSNASAWFQYKTSRLDKT